METSIEQIQGCHEPGEALNAFVQTWITASTNAQGSCTKTCVQLPGILMLFLSTSFYNSCVIKLHFMQHLYPNGHTRLETLESQDQLMNLLQQSMNGVCEARKSLHLLGNTATPDQVAHVLQKVTQQPI